MSSLGRSLMHRYYLTASAAVAVAVVGMVLLLAADPASADDRDRTRTLGEPGDPHATMLDVAVDRFGDAPADALVLARDDLYVDALAASPLLTDAPLLLVPSDDEVPDDTLAMADTVTSDTPEVIVVGGTTAVSDSVANQVADAVDASDVTRLSDDHRHTTAVAISEHVARDAPVDTVALVRDDLWVDAISGGAWAADDASVVVLLTDSETLPDATRDALDRLDPDEVAAIGGTTAVSDTALEAAGAAGDATTSRSSGANRVRTAEAVAEDRLDHDPETAQRTVVTSARTNDWADGLAAIGVAADLRAPLFVFSTSSGRAASISVPRMCPDSEAVLVGTVDNEADRIHSIAANICSHGPRVSERDLQQAIDDARFQEAISGDLADYLGGEHTLEPCDFPEPMRGFQVDYYGLVRSDQTCSQPIDWLGMAMYLTDTHDWSHDPIDLPGIDHPTYAHTNLDGQSVAVQIDEEYELRIGFANSAKYDTRRDEFDNHDKETAHDVAVTAYRWLTDERGTQPDPRR